MTERNIDVDRRHSMADVRQTPNYSVGATHEFGVFDQAEAELRRAKYKPGEIVMILVSDAIAENDPSKFVKKTENILKQNSPQ